MDRETEVVVSGLALDAKSNAPVVILKEKDGERMLPIWIGVFEANAIAMQLADVDVKRPLTYDLIAGILSGLDARVDRVTVNDLKDGTYFARLRLQHADGVVEIDARPSDSIALALRAGAPILAAEKVFAASESGGADEKGSSPGELRERLKNIDPGDFGDFKL